MASRTRRILVLLTLVGFAGCASSSGTQPGAEGTPSTDGAREAEPTPDEAAEAEAASFEAACVPAVTVTVAIVNRSSYDIEVYFDGYRAGRTAEGFTRTTYQVPRYRLHRTVTLNILRGGLQDGGPAYIPIEQVYCNDATILVGARPKYSVFYGDKLYVPRPAIDEGEEPDGSSPEEEAGG